MIVSHPESLDGVQAHPLGETVVLKDPLPEEDVTTAALGLTEALVQAGGGAAFMDTIIESNVDGNPANTETP